VYGKSLKDRIAEIESRLQSIIERGSSRLVSKKSHQNPIIRGLIQSLYSSIRVDEQGRSICADTYILELDAKRASFLEDDSSILEELLAILVENGNRLGASFQGPPRIKISTDPSMKQGEMHISSHYALQEIAETNTLTVPPGENSSIPENAFLIINGDQVYPLTHQVLNLGRRSDNHVVINDPRVSRVHAQIRVINNRYSVCDLESTGGTYVNKVRIDQCVLLPGDVISLAGVDLVYGQDAAYLSADQGGSTQPLMPFPHSQG
jgi:hypothetical protein